MDERELERIRNTDDPFERMRHVFVETGPIEAMVERRDVDPQFWIPCTPGSNEDRERLKHEVQQVELEPGEAVLVHQTAERRAESILDRGFDDPFQHAGDDVYHVPGSLRYGRVFLWPHWRTIGNIDINGASVVCRVDIKDALVSSYDSHTSLVDEETYEWKEEMGFERGHILAEEYNALHVFDYSDYLEWIEESREGWQTETLFPYKLD